MWPSWTFFEAVIVCGRHCCGRRGLWPSWYRPLPRHQRLLSFSRGLARPLQPRLWQLRVCRTSCLSPTTSADHTQCGSSLGISSSSLYHVSDALAILHWLCLPERVNIKLALMANRVLYSMAPPYLKQLVPVSCLPGRRRLQSSLTLQLHVPQYRLSTAGRRSFPVAASFFCNSLGGFSHAKNS